MILPRYLYSKDATAVYSFVASSSSLVSYAMDVASLLVPQTQPIESTSMRPPEPTQPISMQPPTEPTQPTSTQPAVPNTPIKKRTARPRLTRDQRKEILALRKGGHSYAEITF